MGLSAQWGAEFRLRHIWEVKPDFPKECIEVQEINKKSSAHKKAWETQRGIIKPNKRIKARELLEVLRK